MINYISKSENDTIALAEKLGKCIFANAVILLTGDLGAGKTVFVKGLARGMGYDDLVKSPTYNIMNIYNSTLPLIHFDLYRINNTDEFYEIGADEYIGADNVCAVEWHEHAKDALGDEYIEVEILDEGENERKIIISAHGKKHTKWLDSLI